MASLWPVSKASGFEAGGVDFQSGNIHGRSTDTLTTVPNIASTCRQIAPHFGTLLSPAPNHTLSSLKPVVPVYGFAKPPVLHCYGAE
jgi:hypothetical protein